MPTLANIVLADGQASPANVTFVPVEVNGNIVQYNDAADPVSNQRTLALSVSFARRATEFTVTSAVFRIPYVDSTTGKLLWYDQSRSEYRTGYGSTLAKRKDLFAFTKNLHANADFKTMVEARQNMI